MQPAKLIAFSGLERINIFNTKTQSHREDGRTDLDSLPLCVSASLCF
jgi:hypothetical protein